MTSHHVDRNTERLPSATSSEAARRALVGGCSLLVVAALLLVGCGGSGSKTSSKPLTKAAYLQAGKSIVSSLGKDVAPAITGSGDLAAAQQEIRSLADRFGKLAPPAEVAQAQADYVSGLRRFASDLGGLKTKLAAINKGKQSAAALTLVTRLKSYQLLTKAQQEFRAKGYEMWTSASITTTSG